MAEDEENYHEPETMIGSDLPGSQAGNSASSAVRDDTPFRHPERWKGSSEGVRSSEFVEGTERPTDPFRLHFCSRKC